MNKIYLNPFKRTFKTVQPKEEAFLHSIGLTYDELWSKEETIKILETLYLTKDCVGKFDLFNKWVLHDSKDKDINELFKKIYFKPNKLCPKCDFFSKCSNIHLSFSELEILWDEIYKTKAVIFKI